MLTVNFQRCLFRSVAPSGPVGGLAGEVAVEQLGDVLQEQLAGVDVAKVALLAVASGAFYQLA